MTRRPPDWLVNLFVILGVLASVLLFYFFVFNPHYRGLFGVALTGLLLNGTAAFLLYWRDV